MTGRRTAGQWYIGDATRIPPPGYYNLIVASSPWLHEIGHPALQVSPAGLVQLTLRIGQLRADQRATGRVDFAKPW